MIVMENRECGQIIGSPFQVSSGAGRDPNVAWNSATDEFGLVYSGWDDSSAFVALARIGASNGALLRRNIFYRAGGTYITDIIYNTALGRFVTAYVGAGILSTELNAAGDALQSNNVGLGTYDGMALGL